VEFPAYSSQVEQVRDALLRQGFPNDRMQVSRPLMHAQVTRGQGA
jgi:hypothetical protein